MADKLIYIPNDDTQNYPFSKLKLWLKVWTQNNDPTNQNSLKPPKFLSQRIRKHYETFGTSVISTYQEIKIEQWHYDYVVSFVNTTTVLKFKMANRHKQTNAL